MQIDSATPNTGSASLEVHRRPARHTSRSRAARGMFHLMIRSLVIKTVLARSIVISGPAGYVQYF